MKLFLPILLLLASCSASHKIKTSQSRSVDSVATTTKDTTHVTHEETSSSNLQAQGVHIRVDYNQAATPADSAPAAAKEKPAKPATKPPRTGNKFVDAIQDAVAAAGNAGNISSIRIDIGSISDSSTSKVRKDSGAGKTTATTHVQAQEQAKNKEVTREGMPTIVKLSLWLLFILVLLALIYRYRAKFIILKDVIFKFLKL